MTAALPCHERGESCGMAWILCRSGVRKVPRGASKAVAENKGLVVGRSAVRKGTPFRTPKPLILRWPPSGHLAERFGDVSTQPLNADKC
jgi:hypothetical protein